MFFWILIKLTFIPILICWKKIIYLEKFSTQQLSAYFLDETFYHTHTLLFSPTISTTIVIKAAKHSKYYIIHNSYDIATKYSIIRKMYWKMHWKMKSYLTWLVVLIYIFLHDHFLPKYWKILPPSHRFTDHAVKHKKKL